MNFKLSIALSLSFIAFMAVTTLGADWDNQEHLSADELISGIEKNPKAPATPQQVRALRENESAMDWSMPSTLSKGAKDPKASRAEAEAASQEKVKEEGTAAEASAKENASAAAVTTELPPAQVALPSMSGSWSFALNDSLPRSMALTLFQKDEQLFGAGKMRVENSTIDAAASGQVFEDGTARLDIITINPIDLYILSLDLNGDVASGSFWAISARAESWTGGFEGVKIA
ncbi:MAG TPA: hypothetical protein PLY52_05600 [Methanothrix sp.]|jgi:hypothetical protein|uniref:hypothetical protein n=1 Tax=Methanothrix sp. TaxID=90426 RepID=UPI002CCD3EB2|nr:hypothetical protein [Methanothrix sp.]MDI9417178.1 hypothetical protein [Euryarchaeota archaeon]HON35769.1 hypothetical protein [Methanothrix sp.]HRU75281.1 hypothetical protein [Methanothrix sp.]